MNTLLIEVNGVQYSNFESANVSLNLDTISGTFNFSAVSTKNNSLPFKQDDECAIYVNEEKVLSGFIEIMSVAYDSNSHSIDLSGRSKTAEIVDSMISSLELTGNITLKEIIEKVILNIGADIKVVDAVGDIEKFNIAEDKISPEVGENAFEFIEKMARKRHVLLTANGEGEVVLTESGNSSAPSGLQNILGTSDNNINSATVTYDNTERFAKYIAKSQLNVSALNSSGESNSKDIVSQKSTEIIDEEVASKRTGRQLVIQTESASSNGQIEKRIKWEANIRKARSMVYSANLSEFSVKGKIWLPNQLPQVNDEFTGINDKMLINSVIFSQGISGSNVALSLVNKDSYTLKLNEPSSGGENGVGFTS